jgi:hypothetical protein
MRNDSIVSELRQARPIAPADVEPPLDVCERILATPRPSSGDGSAAGPSGAAGAPGRSRSRRGR